MSLELDKILDIDLNYPGISFAFESWALGEYLKVMEEHLSFAQDHYYYTRVTGNATVSYAVEKLFQRNFGATGACDDILLTLYDREEAVVKVDVGFSPPKPGEKANTLSFSVGLRENLAPFLQSVL